MSKYRKEYLKYLHVLHGKEIDRLAVYSNPKTKQLRLQFEDQPELEKNSFKAVLENTEQGLHKIQLVSDKTKRNHDINFALQLIYKQIEDNVISKIEQGRNMARELAALRSMESDHIGVGNGQEIVQKLIIEANNQLQVLKLPKEFNKHVEKLTQNVRKEFA